MPKLQVLIFFGWYFRWVFPYISIHKAVSIQLILGILKCLVIQSGPHQPITLLIWGSGGRIFGVFSIEKITLAVQIELFFVCFFFRVKGDIVLIHYNQKLQVEFVVWIGRLTSRVLLGQTQNSQQSWPPQKSRQMLSRIIWSSWNLIDFQGARWLLELDGGDDGFPDKKAGKVTKFFRYLKW